MFDAFSQSSELPEEDEVRTEAIALAELFEQLRATGALKLQNCRWRAFALALPPRHDLLIDLAAEALNRTSEGNWGGKQHYARASYECGCWIEWYDKQTRTKELPKPSRDLDEFSFAIEQLGSLFQEKACKLHGNYLFYETDDTHHGALPGRGWWTTNRCLMHKGHEFVEGVCQRCSFIEENT